MSERKPIGYTPTLTIEEFAKRILAPALLQCRAALARQLYPHSSAIAWINGAYRALPK